MIIVDVEASGLDYAKDSIVSLGALDFLNPERRFYRECRIWEGAHINKESLAVNGFTEAQITDPAKISEGALIAEFLHFAESCAEHTLAGQNVSFDREYLRAAAGRAGANWNLPYRTIDTHTLAYMHMVKREYVPPTEKKRSALDLDAILNYVGIPSEPAPHNALTGALCHAEVISRLLYDTKMLPEFKEFEIPWL